MFSSNHFSAPFSSKTSLKSCLHLLMYHILFNPNRLSSFLILVHITNILHVSRTRVVYLCLTSGWHLTWVTSLKYSCVLIWLLGHDGLLEL